MPQSQPNVKYRSKKPDATRHQMIQLIQADPDKIVREAKVKEMLGVGVDVEQTKNMKNLAIQALPQVAVAWTGICVVLEVRHSGKRCFVC